MSIHISSSRFDSILLLKILLLRNVEVRPVFDGHSCLVLLVRHWLKNLKLNFNVPIMHLPDRFQLSTSVS